MKLEKIKKGDIGLEEEGVLHVTKHGQFWICTYLFNRKMLTQKEYHIFNRFGAYAFREHPRTMKGYWSHLNDLMEKFSNQASDEDWNHFKPWVTKTLGLINNEMSSV